MVRFPVSAGCLLHRRNEFRRRNSGSRSSHDDLGFEPSLGKGRYSLAFKVPLARSEVAVTARDEMTENEAQNKNKSFGYIHSVHQNKTALK